MKKISKEAALAFAKGIAFNRGNTQVIIRGNNVSMLLHGNRIAERLLSSDVFSATLCGYNTVTTRERLNTLLYYTNSKSRFVQRDFEACLFHTETREITPINSDDFFLQEGRHQLKKVHSVNIQEAFRQSTEQHLQGASC